VELKTRLGEDLKAALRSGDKLRTSVIRLLTALIKNREVEKRGPLTDAEVLQAIMTSCKQRQESMDQYRQGGRQDLVDKEAAELSILQSYMPKPLTSEELQVLVLEAIYEKPSVRRKKKMLAARKKAQKRMRLITE